MNENESISEYYSRFQKLISKLTNVGVATEDETKALVIVNGLYEKFTLIKGIMRNTPGALDLPDPQVIGKLSVDEAELKKAGMDKEIEKGVALKIEAGISKAFSKLETEDEGIENEEELNEMKTLFTKNNKRQSIKRKLKPSFIKRDLKDYVCFTCKEK